MQLKKIREMQIKLLLFLSPYTLVKGQGYCETFRSIEGNMLSTAKHFSSFYLFSLTPNDLVSFLIPICS